ncbi:hypothetical protein K466DRAFT_660140 [Polyporus arcularius HHB13444]|uniref:Uncharacterized protein n=1 Tax=Polyporus arcularius HHB13444 TaxID=1314778 RepID=A0A5C3PZ14_9APHY|nr:hypothetical protein K466DRAFT_660140 [Polyporus arcularius HHB13444]
MATPKRRRELSKPSQPPPQTTSKKGDGQKDPGTGSYQPSPAIDDDLCDIPPQPAMSRRVQRAKGSGQVPTIEADIDISDDIEPSAAAEQPPPRRYNTRTHTRDRRPGLHVGLNWREQKEAREAEELARTQKKATEKSKKLLKDLTAEHETQGIMKLARLEAAREEEEHEEEHWYHEARRARGNRAAASRPDLDRDAQERESHFDEPSPVSGSAYEEDDGASESSDEDISDARVSEVETSPVGREVKGAKGKSARVTATKKTPLTQKERKGKKRVNVLGRIDDARAALSAPTSEGDEDAFTPAYRKTLLARLTTLGTARSSPSASPAPTTTKVLSLPVTPRAAPLPTSNSTSMDIQHPSTTSAISHAPSPTGNLPATTLSVDLLASSSSSAPSSPSPALAWERFRAPSIGGSTALVIGSTRASLLGGSPSPPVASSSSSTLDQLRRQLAYGAIQTSKNDDSTQDDMQLIEGDGFGDADMQSTRGSVVGLGIGRKPQIVHLASVEPQHMAPPKKRKQRTPSGQVPLEKSKSAANLPAWIQPIFDDFVATLIDHYGASGDLWNLNPKPSQNPQAAKSTTLLTVMQEVLDAMLPDKYELKTSDRIAVIARQRVMNWRAAFLERAKTIIKHGIMGYLETRPNATVSELAAWVKATADLKTGAAWYEVPKEPKGINALMSPHLLYIFSPHLKAVEGSLLNISNPPVNALSIACAALDTILARYKSGGYVVEPDDTFDTVNGGGATDEFRETSVEPMLKRHPERWEKLMEMAREYANGTRSRPRKKAKVAAPRRRKVADSSSPARPE